MTRSSLHLNDSSSDNRVPRAVQGLTVAILAGGIGSRLRQVIQDRSKVMAPVHGVPFLTYVLEQISQWGISRVVLCTGVLAESISSCYGSSYRAMDISYSCEPHPLGTAGALRNAMGYFPTFPILVMNGDSFFDVAIDQFLHWHRIQGSSASIALAKVEQAERFGVVHLDTHHGLTQFVEKGRETGPAWVNAGVYLLEQAFLESIPPRQCSSLEYEMFPQWIARGIYGYPSEGRFLDIGIPSTYRMAEEFFPSPPRYDLSPVVAEVGG